LKNDKKENLNLLIIDTLFFLEKLLKKILWYEFILKGNEKIVKN
jgi:hypothetical protein